MGEVVARFGRIDILVHNAGGDIAASVGLLYPIVTFEKQVPNMIGKLQV